MINADKDIKKDATSIEKINLINVISEDTFNIKSKLPYRSFINYFLI